MDKLTSKFQLALQDAQSLALRHDHQQIEPVHIMSALLEQEGGSVRGLLGKAGVNINAHLAMPAGTCWSIYPFSLGVPLINF